MYNWVAIDEVINMVFAPSLGGAWLSGDGRYRARLRSFTVRVVIAR